MHFADGTSLFAPNLPSSWCSMQCIVENDIANPTNQVNPSNYQHDDQPMLRLMEMMLSSTMLLAPSPILQQNTFTMTPRIDGAALLETV